MLMNNKYILVEIQKIHTQETYIIVMNTHDNWIHAQQVSDIKLPKSLYRMVLYLWSLYTYRQNWK